MNPRFSEEKVKPFRLVKYFTFTSLIVMFIGTIVLSVLNTHWARRMELKKSETYALLLVKNLNHQIFIQFFIPVTLKFGKIRLRDKEQFELMDKVVKSALHSFKVDMVTIYDIKENIVSYSFDRELIGKRNTGGTGYQKAVSGRSTSKIVQRGNFFEILLGFPKEIKIITFAPLRLEKARPGLSGPMIGVVEIVQDLSEDYQTIFRFQTLVIITCSLVMAILFLVLLHVVKRGEGIIQRRAQEQLRLKEQLSRSEHLSSLGEMAAGISHEIRNPLGIIKTSAELLRKKIASSNQPNSIPDIIVEEANRLNRIITDFLNFAKPKSLNLNLCQVDQVLEKNITFLAPQIEEHGYVIEKHYNNHLPQIMADSAMLYQAFLNILINAMEAMPDGGKIQVGIDSSDDVVTISFDDEGESIPEDILDKIWNPFFTTKEKGTGLGLGIVKNIIEAHGGNIQISNRPVRGVRVTIELPVRQRGY